MVKRTPKEDTLTFAFDFSILKFELVKDESDASESLPKIQRFFFTKLKIKFYYNLNFLKISLKIKHFRVQ